MTVAVLVNVHARHGSDALGDRIASILPAARVAVTHTLEEAQAWVRDVLRQKPPRVLLSGGGDGTAVALLNELRAQKVDVPVFGLLPLGTGNAWARERMLAGDDPFSIAEAVAAVGPKEAELWSSAQASAQRRSA